ncbi:MAG: ferritin family protein [Oscillospiraceae bacterium]
MNEMQEKLSLADCREPMPYPEVDRVAADPEAARLLSLDYASAKSEMSALTSYMYQHALLLASFPEIADKLECIAIVEMNHARMLASAIVALGGDPKYLATEQNRTEFWCADKVNCARYVKDILLDDIADEKAAVVQYNRHAAVIPIPKVQSLLSRIAMDEALHARLLGELLMRI